MATAVDLPAVADRPAVIETSTPKHAWTGFAVVLGEIGDHEVGSASGLLESSQQLGASLGVAVLATLFFSTISLEKGGPQAAMAAGRALLAAERTLLVTLIMIVVAFAAGWLLPRRAREMH